VDHRVRSGCYSWYLDWRVDMVEANEKFTDAEIVAFEKQYLEAFKELAALEKAKKEAETKSKDIRAKLEEAMNEYGITKIDNEFVSIAWIKENPGKQTIDLDALQKEEPEEYESLLEDYPKITGKKKAYVKITVK